MRRARSEQIMKSRKSAEIPKAKKINRISTANGFQVYLQFAATTQKKVCNWLMVK